MVSIVDASTQLFQHISHSTKNTIIQLIYYHILVKYECMNFVQTE